MNRSRFSFRICLIMEKTSKCWLSLPLYLLTELLNPDEIIKLKTKNDLSARQAGMTILGSGSVVQQLSNLVLIDDFFLIVVPVILGAGKSFFIDVKKTNLKLIEAKSFKNGIVMLHYKT